MPTRNPFTSVRDAGPIAIPFRTTPQRQRGHTLKVLHFRALAALLCVVALRATAAEVAFTLVDQKNQPVADAAVSLVPLDASAPLPAPAEPVVIAQQNQEFSPYVTVVATGTAVTFPNDDKVQHHVYSLSKAKRFEFARYAPGKKESIVFDQQGVVALGCNIHDWMVAYLVVVPTPWFAKSDPAGGAAAKVPAGRYRVEVWHPRLSAPQTREITVPAAGDAAVAQVFQLDLRPDRRIRRAPSLPGGGYK